MLKYEPSGSDFGGTEISSPLEYIFYTLKKANFQRTTVLLTDGGVSNTDGVISLIKNKSSFEERVHSIGIGSGADRRLVI
jgi:uncharacterized protein with von Willebrand factor type A (vWA) domain